MNTTHGTFYPSASDKKPELKPRLYRCFLMSIAGLGGLLYGIDIGIISAALLYLGKTAHLTVAQTSAIMAAVLAGSMLGSLIAGILADLAGRKKMMSISGFLFVSSVLLIVMSHGFMILFCGRLLQGLSGGVIAVVVPLFLAETLSAETRGQGSAVFQFMLTFGIVLAAVIGWYFIQHAEAIIAGAQGNLALIHATQDHAWRAMFLSVIYPGILFLVGTLGLSESPRWLLRKGKREKAYACLRRSSGSYAMEELDLIEASLSEANAKALGQAARSSIWKRKYVIPFALACLVLACNQATGINTILGYLSLILKQAGMTPTRATQGDMAVKLLNCIMSLIAISLIDKKGRKFLLTIGTGGSVLALALAALLFRTEESHHVDVSSAIRSQVRNNILNVTVNGLNRISSTEVGNRQLTVVYGYGDGERNATIDSTSPEAMSLKPPPQDTVHGSLMIRRAFISPQPSEREAWSITLAIGIFIACFAIGPGVVVWLMLSELMPTRIRSVGMGVALLINQGVSTLLASIYLPTVTNYGYAAMFALWAACTVVYFCTAVFLLPETKGKTLEQIEDEFDGRKTHATALGTTR
jgi:SP family myo-inositol transporter-like MFS transporter 13